jgi:hypothetical protein
MQNYPYENQDNVLKPGHYVYTEQLSANDENFITDLYNSHRTNFLRASKMNLGKTITIVTMKESLKGKLTGVAIDHL